MALPKVSQKIALFIVVPVILTMLVTGLVTWPSEEEQRMYQEKKKATADSLKMVKEKVDPLK